ncbi:hypothetical protein JHK87_039758 [Glycine soja]|nr:hypothetical protein JHK87_039758 [Glycine soja]
MAKTNTIYAHHERCTWDNQTPLLYHYITDIGLIVDKSIRFTVSSMLVELHQVEGVNNAAHTCLESGLNALYDFVNGGGDVWINEKCFRIVRQLGEGGFA